MGRRQWGMEVVVGGDGRWQRIFVDCCDGKWISSTGMQSVVTLSTADDGNGGWSSSSTGRRRCRIASMGQGQSSTGLRVDGMATTTTRDEVRAED